MSQSVVPDQPSALLELDALNVIHGPVLTFRPALFLRCLDQRLEAFVATGASRERESDYRTTVRLRWADHPSVEEAWRRSTDYAAVFAPDARRFIQQLLETPGLVFEFRPPNGPPVVAEFNGQGLDTYLPRLSSRCRGVLEAITPIPAPPGGVPSGRVYGESEVDAKAELRSMPRPEYPAILRRAGIQGRVIVQVAVDTSGRVEPGSPRVLSTPHPDFIEPAITAALDAVFTPARVRGQAVRVRTALAIEFRNDSL
jgi:TonB family protein